METIIITAKNKLDVDRITNFISQEKLSVIVDRKTVSCRCWCFSVSDTNNALRQTMYLSTLCLSWYALVACSSIVAVVCVFTNNR